MTPIDPTPTPSQPDSLPQPLPQPSGPEEASAAAQPAEPEVVASGEGHAVAPDQASPPHEAPEPADPLAAATSEAHTPPTPTLPPQPVPQVAPAPQPHDLSRLAQDLQIRRAQVEAVVQLLDDQNTVPFITRYRKERTGGLDEVAIRRIKDRITQLRDLAGRKQTILRSVANQGRLTDEWTQAVLEADHPRRLEDLYLPFKPKKKTLASDARDKGLEPLALAIWNRDPAVEKLDEVLPGMVDPWKQLHSIEDVLTGVKHILSEVVAESADVRGPLRAFAWDTGIFTTARVETTPEGKGQEYRDYFQFKEPARAIPPHRVLAINRGERENVLRVRLDVDPIRARDIALSRLPLADHPHRERLLPVVDDAVHRLVLPSLEREVRRELTERAQDHAVDIFSRNLRSLLMRPPLGGKRVLAIDPGIRTGCKLAVLDETGNLLEETVVYPHPPQKKAAQAKRKLEQLIRKYQTSVIAIGNGTACRETEQLVADLIAEFDARRLNPPPVVSPIEPVSASTVAESTPATTTSEAATTATTETAAEPAAEAVSTATTPAIAELLGTAETMTVMAGLPELGDGAVVVGGDAGPVAESAVVQSPAVEAAPPKPPAPPEPLVDLTGLSDPPSELAYVIVNEAGASDYSASPVAKEEFPNLEATIRGTISIGRRLQDPLAELVKVDPQHVGVGLYQHDVRAKYLRQSVESVIESCVNAAGIDVNTASAPLLAHVSGLNTLVARELVEYRRQHGPFRGRDQLKNIPHLGEVRFTQAAGFLKVRDGDDPLDNTWIHPESYPTARQFLADLGLTPTDLRDKAKVAELREKLRPLNPDEVAAKLGVGGPTMWDIFDALAKPGHDPRDDRPQPIFRKGVLRLEDLSAGMELKGEVLNVVDFGAFVDVGLKDSGLVHISQMANRYIRSPYDVIAVGDVVSVWVLSVDPGRRRVSLSMIQPGQERRPPERSQHAERPPRGERPPRSERPQHAQGERPPLPPRPEGPQPRPFTGGPRPGAGAPGGGPRTGGPRPRGPGAPGWRSGPKPPPTPTAPAEGAAAAEGTPPAQPAAPPAKKPPKARPVTKLSDTQKAGREPVYSFAQLAALMKSQEAPPPAPPEKPADTSPPAAPENSADTPPAG